MSPVLCEVRRGGWVESRHRGRWALVDADGALVEGAGPLDEPVFARSSAKLLQAVPLLESGAAERFALSDEHLAVAVASHSADPAQLALVEDLLARAGLDARALRCGPQPRPWLTPGEETALHNNCSGKHAGFLALSVHLGAPVERHLELDSPAQRLVQEAVARLTGVDAGAIHWAVDGCSAPTPRLPLAGLAAGHAAALTAAPRLAAAATAHPELVGRETGRLCTDIMRATRGSLYAKIGAEGLFVTAHLRHGWALAVKCDDGAARGVELWLVAALTRLGALDPPALAELHRRGWGERTLRNWAGVVTGELHAPAAALPTARW